MADSIDSDKNYAGETFRATVALGQYSEQHKSDVIRLGDDFGVVDGGDPLLPYSLPGSDGTWTGRPFLVTRATRREAAETTYGVSCVDLEA